MGSRSLSPIRVAPGGRYFETFEGEPFLFIGANDAITWPGLEGLYRRKGIQAVEAYLEGMAASGVTVLRLMLEYAQKDGRYFERPVGKPNPAMVRLWDDLFRLCGEMGLRVLLAPWDNFWMARRWHRHPYNVLNGGPAVGPGDFFTNEEVLKATEARFRFIVQRWGGNGVLAAWDLFNEIHPYWGGSPMEQAAAITRLSDAIREAETSTWGFTRPQTVSIFGPEPPPEYEDLIFRHPSLDFATTHIYKGAIDFPKDTLRPAKIMAHYVRHALERMPSDRPFTDTEHGPIHLFNDLRKMLPEAFDDEYERRLMWAHLASGGAGSGLRWPARNPHVLTAGMRRSLSVMAAFVETLDWRHFRPGTRIVGLITGGKRRSSGWTTMGLGSDRQALALLLKTKDAPAVDTVEIRGLASGTYRAQVWDIARGPVTECAEQEAKNGKLLVPLPTIQTDFVVSVRSA